MMPKLVLRCLWCLNTDAAFLVADLQSAARAADAPSLEVDLSRITTSPELHPMS